MKKAPAPSVLTASEIGEFAYCAKAWHLKRCGEKADSPQLAAGETFHHEHGFIVTRAEQFQRTGKRIGWLAVVLLMGLFFLWLLMEKRT